MSGPLRFRLYVGGVLVSEELVPDDVSEAELEARAAAQAELVTEDGPPWMLEVYNPDAPLAFAYVRLGTDASLMRNPHEIDLESEELSVELMARWLPRP